MRYCKRCLYPENHPLGLTFDEQGVCSGCRVHEEKDELDWNARFDKLKRIVEPYRSKTRTIHDCIVPVSGGRDSYFIVHVVKNLLGLNPLLVSYNKHYNTETGIYNLAHLQTLLGCDLMMQTVKPQTVKKITRETLRLKGSMYWHCLAGETVFPVQTASKFKIPLIIWGAHQGCDQVGMFSHLDEVEMTRKYRKEHDLMGLEAEDLLAAGNALDYADIEPYVYPHDQEIRAIGIRGIYLNNYVRWDSKAQHEAMIAKYGYRTRSQQRTFDSYNDADSHHYNGIHDYIKYIKWGYSKVTDHATREIRLRRLSRNEAIRLVQQHQDTVPQDAALFAEWLGLSEMVLMAAVEQFRNKDVWTRDGSGNWQLASPSADLGKSKEEGIALKAIDGRGIRLENSLLHHHPKHILFGRGWEDV